LDRSLNHRWWADRYSLDRIRPQGEEKAMSTSTDLPRVAPDLIWRLLDDNVLIVSPRVGEVRVLNRVGTVIWQLLIAENTPPAIEDYLVSHFQVSQQDAHTDLQKFFDDLTDRGIIVWETCEV
jgi:hypothetical protein